MTDKTTERTLAFIIRQIGTTNTAHALAKNFTELELQHLIGLLDTHRRKKVRQENNDANSDTSPSNEERQATS